MGWGWGAGAGDFWGYGCEWDIGGGGWGGAERGGASKVSEPLICASGYALPFQPPDTIYSGVGRKLAGLVLRSLNPRYATGTPRVGDGYTPGNGAAGRRGKVLSDKAAEAGRRSRGVKS